MGFHLLPFCRFTHAHRGGVGAELRGLARSGRACELVIPRARSSRSGQSALKVPGSGQTTREFIYCLCSVLRAPRGFARTLWLLPLRTLRHETLSESVSCRTLPSATGTAHPTFRKRLKSEMSPRCSHRALNKDLGCVSLPRQVGDRGNWKNLREGSR